MKIRVVEEYKDKLLDKEMKVGDIYEVEEARGRQILATGWVEEVVEEEPTPEETIEEEVKEEIKEDKPKRKPTRKPKTIKKGE